MGIPPLGKRGVLSLLGAGFVLGVGLVFVGASAESTAAGGAHPELEPDVVLTGVYTCTYAVTSYITAPDEPPTTYAETSDSLTMNTTAGLAPTRMDAAPGLLGPGSGRVGRFVLPSPVSGFGTGHSFSDGSIEDCVRFAHSMATAVSGLGCTTSALHRRQPPEIPNYYTPSASFSFVCEGSATELVHGMGALSRAVLALNLQPAN